MPKTNLPITYKTYFNFSFRFKNKKLWKLGENSEQLGENNKIYSEKLFYCLKLLSVFRVFQFASSENGENL